MVQPDPKPVDEAPRHQGGVGMSEFVDERHVQAEPPPCGTRDAEDNGAGKDAQQGG